MSLTPLRWMLWIDRWWGALSLWHVTVIGLLVLVFMGERWKISRETALILLVSTILVGLLLSSLNGIAANILIASM